MKLLFSLSLILIYLKQVQPQDNIFEFSPNQPLCLGEEVTLTCYLFPDTTPYTPFAFISFNQSTPETVSTINIDRASIGYSATVSIPVMGSSARIQLTIASFRESDNNTLFGCHAELADASITAAIESGYPPIAAPPPTPTNTAVSLSSLSPATCSNTLVSWTAPATTDRPIDTYYVYRNSSLLAVTTDTSHTDTDQLMLDTNYRYSVIASSCASNSTPSNDASVYVQSFSLVTTVATPLFLSYAEETGELTLEWKLAGGNFPLLLSYSLVLSYSHSQYETVYEFNNSSAFSLPSDVSIHSVPLTPHSFSTADAVVTNITACVNITKQCGMAFSGGMLCTNFDPANAPTTTQPQPTTAATTFELTTNITVPIKPTVSLPIGAIAGAAGGILLISILILITVLTAMMCIYYCVRYKSTTQTVPAQPLHTNEYIDIRDITPAVKSDPT